MVYGRYNELVNGGYFMVYKPTYNWGAPSCRMLLFYLVLGLHFPILPRDLRYRQSPVVVVS